MQEFTTVSASFYDPAALANKLTEKSSEGWFVVSIVSTGGDVTAFLARETDGSAPAVAPAPAMAYDPAPAPAPEPAPAPAMSESAFATTFSADPMPPMEPTMEPAAAPAEPAGWAMAPEPAPAPAPEPAPAAPAAASAVPAGWYADPAGRFELRYWDGGTWTEHVSRAGQQYTDPPVA